MKAGTWKIISAINTTGNEFIVMGYDPNSPTPFGTWQGTIKDNQSDFIFGHYFTTKEEAFNDLIKRSERFYQ